MVILLFFPANCTRFKTTKPKPNNVCFVLFLLTSVIPSASLSPESKAQPRWGLTQLRAAVPFPPHFRTELPSHFQPHHRSQRWGHLLFCCWCLTAWLGKARLKKTTRCPSCLLCNGLVRIQLCRKWSITGHQKDVHHAYTKIHFT